MPLLRHLRVRQQHTASFPRTNLPHMFPKGVFLSPVAGVLGEFPYPLTRYASGAYCAGMVWVLLCTSRTYCCPGCALFAVLGFRSDVNIQANFILVQ